MSFLLNNRTAVGTLMLLGSWHVYGQTARSAAESPRLKTVLLENHFQPRAIDDGFSRDVFDRTVNELDPNRLYFTAADLRALQSFRNLIDDEWTKDHLDFVPALTSAYKHGLERADRLLAVVAKEKIDWTANDEFSLDEKLAPMADELALKERWRQWIKYKILNQIRNRLDQDSTITHPDLSFVALQEVEEKKKAVKAESRSIHQILDAGSGPSEHAGGTFLKAVAAAFDPHSMYLSPFEIENFMGGLSSQEFSFGLELREQSNGDIAIERLVPGSPAWKCGELHRSDVLVSMRLENKTVVSLSGIGIEELSTLLETNNHLAIELTVRTAEGAKVTVFLRKEKMEDQNNIVRGFVLHGKNKIGYISLPGFYSDWGSEGGSSCADDMTRQILKMKKENIQGLILDLRSNGGGSVSEAIELAGIFVDDGPLAIFKNRSGSLTTLKDVNRGTIYDGPLVVLINGQSASASELVAAALQDYHRAIIAGSPSYGKATGQKIFSLDPSGKATKLDPAQKPEYGFATVTVEKIYRVSGKSVQGRGIQPDISLPDLFDQMEIHEDHLPNALPADSIIARVPYRAVPPLPLPALQKLSAARVAANPWFEFIRKLGRDIGSRVADQTEIVSLRWDSFLMEKAEDISQNVALKGVAPFERVTLPQYERTNAPRSMYASETSDAWIPRLTSDDYVAEAYRVLADYLTIKRK